MNENVWIMRYCHSQFESLYDTSLKLDYASDPTKHAQSLDHKVLTKTAHD